MAPELMILIILQIENLLSNNFFNLEIDYINEGLFINFLILFIINKYKINYIKTNFS